MDWYYSFEAVLDKKILLKLQPFIARFLTDPYECVAAKYRAKQL